MSLNTLIYIDCDNFSSNVASNFLAALKCKFGPRPNIYAYVTLFAANRRQNHIQQNNFKAWSSACHNAGLSPIIVQPPSNHKNSTDSLIMIDVLDHYFQNRDTPLRIILASGDSDFYFLVRRLRQYGVNVVVVGSPKTSKFYSKSACRFITEDTLLGKNLLPLDDAQKLIDNHITQKCSPKVLEDRIIDATDGRFWSEQYGCTNFHDLLTRCGYSFTDEEVTFTKLATPIPSSSPSLSPFWKVKRVEKESEVEDNDDDDDDDVVVISD
ncbi:hypothetical protein GEMRC1_004710 [Eukaryota sp. GEM-RC1]